MNCTTETAKLIFSKESINHGVIKSKLVYRADLCFNLELHPGHIADRTFVAEIQWRGGRDRGERRKGVGGSS